jgi:hypothetical protein
MQYGYLLNKYIKWGVWRVVVIMINGMFLIDFKWSVLGPLILIAIAD